MSEPKFVVLRHNVGAKLDRTSESHFDWMFEIEGLLWTWATAPFERFDQSIETDCYRLADHRIDYLEYEGDLSGERGSVCRVLSGNFEVIENHADRFVAQLAWGSGMKRQMGCFMCQRMKDDCEPSLD